MPAQPQTTYNDIIGEINRLVTQPEAADEMSIYRIRHQAEALVKVDAAKGYMALGALASLQDDAKSVKEWHDKSIKLLQGDAGASYNYAVSLQRVGCNSDSAKYAETALRLAGHQRDYVKLFLETTVGGGNFMRALSHFHGDKALPESFQSLADVVGFIKEGGFSDEDFAPLAQQAEEVALMYATPFRSVELGPFYDDVIVLNLPVQVADPCKLADMNETLADRLAAIDAKPGVISSLVITFTSID